jgi:hypothetical protein
MEFGPNHLQPYPSCTSSLPAPSYLRVAESDLRRAVTKVKYTLFLFSAFSEQRPILSLTLTFRYKSEVHTFSLVTPS